MSVSQREATFNAITIVISNNNVNFNHGQNVKSVLTSSMKKAVKDALIQQFKAGKVDCTEEFRRTKLSSDSELSKYCSGLISNWIKKDPRLNGNNQYQAVNKGTRIGQSDLQVKELRKLLKITVGTDAQDQVSQALSARLDELKAAKAPQISIDVTALPEHLRHLVK
jgi:hypothetical protein